ncbi:MAG: response regulator [Marinoscillum sp.]
MTVDFGFGQKLGLPPIKYFSTQEYHAGSRNWSIVDDSLGVLYAANEEGVLRYDGVSWEKFTLPGKQFPYWLEKDKQGDIYLGANGDFGKLSQDSKGLLIYESFVDMLSEDFKDFNVVWEIAVSANGIGFRSKKYMFFYSSGTLTGIRPPEGGAGFDVAYSVRDTIFTRVVGLGLAYVDGRGVHIIPGTEQMGSIKVNGFFQYGTDKMLIATRHEGFYIFDGKGLTKFATDVDEYLLENKIYDGHLLSDGNYAIATMGNGLVVIDPKGHEVFRFDSGNGLGTNQTLFVREIEGQIWLGTKNGIFQIYYGSPYKQIGREFGIAGQVTSILAHQGNTYVTSNNGLYRLERGHNKSIFVSINEDPIVDCVGLFELDSTLYMCSLEALHSYSYDEGLKFIANRPFLNTVMPTDQSEVFIASGFYFGVRILDMTSGEPGLTDVKGINRLVTQIVQIEPMTFLVRSVEDIVYKVKVSNKSDGYVGEVIETLKLPDNTYIIPLDQKLALVSGRSEDLVQFDESYNLIETNNKLKLNRSSSQIVLISTLGKQRSFISYKDEPGSYYTEEVAIQNGDIVTVGPSLYSGFEPECIFLDDQSNEVWIGGAAGIISYDQSAIHNQLRDDRLKIRQLVVNRDSTIYSNFNRPHIFTYLQNDIRIAFADLTSSNDGSILFSYRLDDESAWSEWRSDNFVHFSKMGAGKYTFEVRSRSTSGDISTPAQLSFQIRRPWYYSDVAIVLYSLLICLLGFGFYWGRVKVLLHRQEELKGLVNKQTKQLAEANNELSLRATKLEHLGAFKARFFANISHDLRTPIMLLSGRIAQLMNDQNSHFSETAKGYIEKLEKDIQSLVRLTNEIKDLVEIEEGKINLDYRRVTINSFFRRVVSLFSSAVDQKDITLSFKSELADDHETAFDHHYLERTIYNLISNAIKYTEEGGKIAFELKIQENTYSVHVKDNGRGISQKDQEEIFNRSFQAGNAYNIHEGLGIGLNVVKELVSLHRGEVSVKSALGEGSEFIVTLPLEDANLFERHDKETFTSKAINQPQLKADTKTILFEKESKPVVLLVEDHPDVRDYFTNILEGSFELITSENGSQALEVLKHRTVDLVITDLMMPVMDGFEFIEGVKTNRLLQSIPVMVVSARDSQEDRYRIMHMGINNILVKPFEPHELILRAKNMITDNSGSITVKRVLSRVEAHHQTTLEKLDQSIMKHIADSNLKVSTLAEELNQSERSFFRMVKKIAGMSPLEYIKEIKMQYAMDLIKKKRVTTIKELSSQVGIKSSAELSKQFHSRFGARPGDLL